MKLTYGGFLWPTDTKCFGIIFSFLLCLLTQCNGIKLSTHRYMYTGNITEQAQPHVALQVVRGFVHIAPFTITPLKSLDNFLERQKKLLYVETVLENDVSPTKMPMTAVVEFEEDGTVDRIHLLKNPRHTTTMINVLKGIISVFVINPVLEPGREMDSSGICHAVYAEDTKSNNKETIIDKIKSSCRQLQKPIDVWNRNTVSSGSQEPNRGMYTRYHIDRKTGMIRYALGYEEWTHSALRAKLTNAPQFKSWQELRYVEDVKNDDLLKLEKTTPTKVQEAVQTILGEEILEMHLAPGFIMEDPTDACSLNTQLFQPSSSLDVPPLNYIREAIEAARSTLHSPEVDKVPALHKNLQLIRLLRCLPDGAETVDRLNHASLMSPPAIKENMLHRQANSWRDQLTEVLIACATPNCISVVIQRLEALTAIVRTNQAGSGRDVEIVHEMLFTRLWPALAHIKQPSTGAFERMLDCCHVLSEQSQQITCLTALSNMWPHLKKKSEMINVLLVSMVHSFLDLKLSNGTQKIEDVESNAEKNTRIMSGLSIVTKLHIPEVYNQVLKIVTVSEGIYPTVKAFAIRTITSMVTEMRETPNDMIIQLKGEFMHMLLEIPFNSENNLIIGRALFQALLTLDTDVDSLKRLFEKFVQLKQWSLIRACRLLVKEACKLELFPNPICTCFEESHHSPSEFAQSDTCNIGLARGWSGLTADHRSIVGKETVIHGKVFNLNNNSFSSEYSLHVINGQYGELRSSQVNVRLIDMEEVNDLFAFEINANGLETLMGITPSPSSDKSQQHVDDTAWLNLRLTNLENSLPPRTVFTGSYMQLLSTLWSIPTTPTTMFRVLQSILDAHEYTVFSAGWLVSVNTLGLVSMEISGAMETSAWSMTGRSLVRTQAAVVVEVAANVLPVFSEKEEATPTTVELSIFNGFGMSGELNFVTEIHVSKLPEAVCMSMYRGEDLDLFQWNATQPTREQRMVDKRSRFVYRELQNDAGRQTTVYNWLEPGISYDLGRNNSIRCKQMKVSNPP